MPISEQHGFSISAQRETELHPQYQRAWEKRRDSLLAMRELVNRYETELADIKTRIGALEEAVRRLPFPVASS